MESDGVEAFPTVPADGPSFFGQFAVSSRSGRLWSLQSAATRRQHPTAAAGRPGRRVARAYHHGDHQRERGLVSLGIGKIWDPPLRLRRFRGLAGRREVGRHGWSEGHEMLKRNDKYHSIADDVPIPKM